MQMMSEMETLTEEFQENTQDVENLWSAETVDGLINLVRKNAAIYDQCNPEHSNRDVVDQVWRGIGLKLNRTAEACSKKWQALRSGYRKRKNAYVPSGSGAKKIKKWAYFDSLNFLEPYINERKTVTNLISPDIELSFPAGSSSGGTSRCSSAVVDGFIINLENAVVDDIFYKMKILRKSHKQ